MPKLRSLRDAGVFVFSDTCRPLEEKHTFTSNIESNPIFLLCKEKSDRAGPDKREDDISRKGDPALRLLLRKL